MAITEDKQKQKNMKLFYDNSNYYEDAGHNFVHVRNTYKKNLLKNVFSIYSPKKGEKIADLGCGWGNVSLELQGRGFDVTSLDYSYKSIDICKKTATKLGLDPSKFFCRDATDTRFCGASFDLVYCVDFVEHIYSSVYDNLLREVCRILKAGGKFIIYTPNPSHIFEILKKNNIVLKKDISHVDYKTMARLRQSLIRRGFHIEKAFYMESHVPVFSILERHLMRYIPIFRRRNAVLAIRKNDL